MSGTTPRSEVNWPAIRQAFEAGEPKGALSRAHGISRQAIIYRSRTEGWQAPAGAEPEPPEPCGCDEPDPVAPILTRWVRLLLQRRVTISDGGGRREAADHLLMYAGSPADTAMVRAALPALEAAA